MLTLVTCDNVDNSDRYYKILSNFSCPVIIKIIDQLIFFFYFSLPANICLGRRIVDIFYVFEQIRDSEHSGGFGCSFINMLFISEKRQGFCSQFKFKCNMCGVIKFIQSEKSNSKFLPINEGIVSGTIAIGIGHSQLAELTATIDIPCMSPTTYFKVQTSLSEKIHNVALQEMLLAGEEEKKIALECGNVDNDGIPMCTVVADGQWSKRSYRTKYDALSGVVIKNIKYNILIHFNTIKYFNLIY